MQEWMNDFMISSSIQHTHRSPPLSRLSRVLEFQEKCHCSRLIAVLMMDHWGFSEAIFFFLIL